MSTVINVENLGKKYLLSHQKSSQQYVALRDVIAEQAKAAGRRILHPFRSSSHTPPPLQEEFWALKDVSFEVKQGDRIGIIGRNGAGKSTLLKILSRITEPTTGSIRIKGRVASLLEVGTGFHPELTGRENIFLNGAILGMGRAEIKKKFDEIVDFAEIERFLDTPVKRYSSGMYVRLAFAVAAHLEPEILVVDEVLSVGDAQFQKKCLGKMEDAGKEGRTVLFVSHNLAAISSLCSRGFFLEKGGLQVDNDVIAAIGTYMNNGVRATFERLIGVVTTQPFIRKAWFENKEGEAATQFYNGDLISLIIDSENPNRLPTEISIAFFDNLRRPLWNFQHSMYGLDVIPLANKVRSRLTFYPPKLTISELLVDIAIGPKGGAPFYENNIEALKCIVIEPKSEFSLTRFPEWPILTPTSLYSEIIEM